MTRILLADADPRTQRELTAVLQPRGHESPSPATVPGLTTCARGEADLLLAELNLPACPVSTCCCACTRSDRCRRHPDGRVRLGRGCRAGHARGCGDFLSKPFTPEQVLVAVDRAIEKAQLLHENQVLRGPRRPPAASTT